MASVPVPATSRAARESREEIKPTKNRRLYLVVMILEEEGKGTLGDAIQCAVEDTGPGKGKGRGGARLRGKGGAWVIEKIKRGSSKKSGGRKRKKSDNLRQEAPIREESAARCHRRENKSPRINSRKHLLQKG